MRQLFQNLKDGKVFSPEVPAPSATRGTVVVRPHCSLVSPETEQMLSQFGKAGLIKKAQSPPEKVRQVLAKVSTDGLLATAQAVRNKLDQPLPLGYSAVGTVTEVGEGVTGFSIGDRVVCNGNHAEAVVVPENLVAHVRADWRTKHAPVGLRSGIIKALGFQTEALFSPGPHLQTSRPHKHSQVESWLTLTN